MSIFPLRMRPGAAQHPRTKARDSGRKRGQKRGQKLALGLTLGLTLGLGLAGGSLLGARAALAQDSLTLAIDPLITLDPAFARGTGQDLSILSQIYSALTTYTPEGELVGDLATGWTDKGATEFTFTLREGVRFANGEPLDAAAVVWNINRMKAPETQATANTDFNLIASAEALDATTLVIRTSQPWVDLPRRMSWFFLLAPEWAASHNPKIAVNESGPYRLESYDFASHVSLVRNPDYYGASPAHAAVTYRVIANTPARIAGLRSGEIDASLKIDPIDLAQLAALPDYTVGAVAGRRVHVLRFNLDHPAVADLRVRQAINFAINRELITKSLYRGLIEPATPQVLNPADAGYDPDLPVWPYDPERAKALLAEAGHGAGLTLTIGATGEAGYIQGMPAVQAIAGMLAEVGITLQIQTVPGASWVSFLRDKANAPDMAYLGYVSGSNAPAELLGQFVTTAPYTWGTMPEAYDAAVAAAKTAADPESQRAALRQAVHTAADQALLVYLWAQPQTFAKRKGLEWTIRADDWVKASDIGKTQP